MESPLSWEPGPGMGPGCHTPSPWGALSAVTYILCLSSSRTFFCSSWFCAEQAAALESAER